MPVLPILFKTVSSGCNLDCSYCYYRESLRGTRALRIIEQPVLDVLVPQYLEYVADAGVASFVWQGGEPTLAGLDFFERIVALEAKHAGSGMALGNALQTNGVLLDDRWGEFLREYNFLVGISLDGPEDVHDSIRRDRGGHGSFRRVMAGVDVLRRHGVEFNILCVVGPHNAGRVSDLMHFFRSEGLGHLQFIPAMSFQSVEPDDPAGYLITADEYGDFLIELFDDWYEQGFPKTSIRTFDALMETHLGLPSGLCIYGERCDSGIIVESDGSIYPCDFYVHQDWCLGSIVEEPLQSILAKPKRVDFVEHKAVLSAECTQCEWRWLCRGGCPRNRQGVADGSPEYFCASHQRFFSQADERLRALKDRIERRLNLTRAAGRETVARRVVTERNERCPCGSGRKYKACCGDPRADQSYLFRV